MICVDASLAAKWVLVEDDSEKAVYLYREYRNERVIAPAFFPVEVTNAIWRGAVRGQFSPREASEKLAAFLDYSVELTSPSSLYELALRLADEFDRPTVYDMHYVALAQIAGCDLWTADQRLLHAVGGRLPFVKDLAVYSPP